MSFEPPSLLFNSNNLHFLIQGSQTIKIKVGILANREILILLNVPLVRISFVNGHKLV